MNPHNKTLKTIHVCGTVWLAMCAIFLLIVALRQAGFQWWIIFSISSYSGVAFFLLFSVYLFAIFRGVVRIQIAAEHPLTTSIPYIAFYDLCPFMGTFAGLVTVCSISPALLAEKLSTIAEGTLGMSFLVWIFCDPLIGIIETALPASRAGRRRRIARARIERRRKEEQRQDLLRYVFQQTQESHSRWNQTLEPLAAELADLLIRVSSDRFDALFIQRQVIAKGAGAWEIGGIGCMRHLYQLVQNQLRQQQRIVEIDYLATWWDGIGSWRKPPFLKLFLTPKVNR